MKLPRKLHPGQTLAIAGGLIIAGGAAAPLLHVPIAGTISYLHQPDSFPSGSHSGAIVIFAAAALAIAASLAKLRHMLWVAGILPLAQLAVTVVGVNHMIATAEARADAADLADPGAMWAGAILSHTRYEWGIAIIAVGAAMVLAAAALRDRSRSW